jgi:hypothetical protein
MGKLKESSPGIRNNKFQSLIEAFLGCNGRISNLPWKSWKVDKNSQFHK